MGCLRGLSVVFSVALAVVLGVVLPVSAGSPQHPEMVDPAGDVGFLGVGAAEPWQDSVDFTAFWINNSADAVRLGVAMQDLAAVEGSTPYAAGLPLFVRFQFDVLTPSGGNESHAADIQFHHVATPLHGVGWQFRLDGKDVAGTADLTNSTLQIELPATQLDAAVGEMVVDVWEVISWTLPTPTGYGSGDGFAACRCPWQTTAPEPAPEGPAEEPSPALNATATEATVAPNATRETASSSTLPPASGPAPSNGSPGLPAAAVAAVVAVAAWRRAKP